MFVIPNPEAEVPLPETAPLPPSVPLPSAAGSSQSMAPDSTAPQAAGPASSKPSVELPPAAATPAMPEAVQTSPTPVAEAQPASEAASQPAAARHQLPLAAATPAVPEAVQTAPAPVAEAQPAASAGVAPAIAIAVDAGDRNPAQRRMRARRQSKSATWLTAVGGVVGLMAVIGMAYVAITWSSGEAPSAGGVLSSREGALVLDWPKAERADADLRIDGRRVQLAADGALQYPLDAGQHRLQLRRRGYEPLDVTFQVVPGGQFRYAPVWQQMLIPSTSTLASGFGGASELAITGYDGWTQNYERAKQQAAQQNRDVLVAFVSSDGSEDCLRLANEVFQADEFRQLADKHFERVVVDFPQTESGYNRVVDSAQNAYLRDHFGVEQVPTLVFADASGRPYAIDIPELESTAEYLRQLQAMPQRRAERDELLAAAESGEETMRVASATEAAEWLGEQGLLRFYGRELSSWLALARRADPENKNGQLEVLFEADWLVRLIQQEDHASLARIAAELERWNAEQRFVDPDRAARLYLIGARLLLELEDEEKAYQLVELGLTYEPSERELRDGLQSAARLLKNRDRLSTGTGFVIASGGYLLTNHHVVEGEGRLVVILPDQEEPLPAELVAHDAIRDMAVIRVDAEKVASLAPLPLSTASLNRGSQVAAFGFPLGDAVGSGLKLTTGVISALPEQSENRMLLLDCRVNPGNSGGPLCNQQGAVIGMVTAKSNVGFGVDSYGMALPADDLQSFLKQHVPDYAPPSESSNSERLGWDQVDQRVSPAVLMIAKMKE